MFTLHDIASIADMDVYLTEEDTLLTDGPSPAPQVQGQLAGSSDGPRSSTPTTAPQTTLTFAVEPEEGAALSPNGFEGALTEIDMEPAVDEVNKRSQLEKTALYRLVWFVVSTSLVGVRWSVLAAQRPPDSSK